MSPRPGHVRRQRRRKRFNWPVISGFFVFCALVYAALQMAMGDPWWKSVLSALLWAAFFVPVMVWLMGRTSAMVRQSVRHGSEPHRSREQQDAAHPAAAAWVNAE